MSSCLIRVDPMSTENILIKTEKDIRGEGEELEVIHLLVQECKETPEAQGGKEEFSHELSEAMQPCQTFGTSGLQACERMDFCCKPSSLCYYSCPRTLTHYLLTDLLHWSQSKNQAMWPNVKINMKKKIKKWRKRNKQKEKKTQKTQHIHFQ